MTDPAYNRYDQPPPDSAYEENARRFYGATPAAQPKQNLEDQDFQNSVNQFYGNSNPASRGNMGQMDAGYEQNSAAFYGVTPREGEFPQQADNSMDADARKFYGVDSRQSSRPAGTPSGNSLNSDARKFYGVDSRQSDGPVARGNYNPPPPQPQTPVQQDNQQVSNPYGNQGEFSPPDFNQNFNAALNGKPIYKGMGFKDTRGLLG